MGLCLLLLVLGATPAYALKYQSWFYWYTVNGNSVWTDAGILTNVTIQYISNQVCNATLNGYVQSTNNGVFQGHGPVDWCYFHEDCLLANMRPSWLQNYQAGAVILGIMPTLLASLGPRIGEISLLSTHRPFLSLLLSIGAPAVWPTRVFSYDDPKSCLEANVNKMCLSEQPPTRAKAISAVQYILSAASIVNLMQTAITLGRQTVLSWSCTLDYGPLAWSLIPLSIHTLAAVSYKVEVWHAEKEIVKRLQESSPDAEDPLSISLRRSNTWLEQRHQASGWKKELTICANQPKGLEDLLKFKRVHPLAVFLNCISSLMAFFHLLFGTILFSSIVFIAVSDILNAILWRYLLSTVLCRLILLVELGGMRKPQVQEVDKLAMQVDRLQERVYDLTSRSATWDTAYTSSLASPPLAPPPTKKDDVTKATAL